MKVGFDVIRLWQCCYKAIKKVKLNSYPQLLNLHCANVLWDLFDHPLSTLIVIDQCANHAVKYYHSRLEQLSKDFPSFHGQGSLTETTIIKSYTVPAILIAIIPLEMTGQTKEQPMCRSKTLSRNSWSLWSILVLRICKRETNQCQSTWCTT